jgi:glycosyltransferase involved in cell wall biosynthesis
LTAERPLRVLYFASQFALQSGATHAMMRLAQTVRENGNWTMIVAPVPMEQQRRLEENGVRVVAMDLRTPRGMRAIKANLLFLAVFIPHVLRVARIILRERIEIVHVTEIFDVVGIMAAWITGRRCLMHIRADLDPRLVSRGMLVAARLMSNVLAHIVDMVIIPSQSVLRSTERAVPAFRSRLKILYEVAFDTAQFRSDIDGTVFRHELGLTPLQPLVLLISKLAIVKGHLVFLDAAAMVAAEEPGVIFVDVGDVMTDHYEEAATIREHAQVAGQHADIRMMGYRSDLPQIFAACDVFVHCPTYHDPYPTVVPQAMFMGNAVIGSRIGGIPEQIADGQTGLLVEPDDAEALAGAILRLVRDRALRQRLAAAGEKEARTRHVPSAQALAQIALYRVVLERRRA